MLVEDDGMEKVGGIIPRTLNDLAKNAEDVTSALRFHLMAERYEGENKGLAA